MSQTATVDARATNAHSDAGVKELRPLFPIPLGRGLLWAGLIIGTASCHCPARCHAEPATKDRADLAAILTEQGVEVAEHLRAQLPAAIVRLDTGDDDQSLHELAGAAGWDRFIEDAVTAPVTVMIEAVAAGDTRLGHRVRTAFVIHAALEKLQGEEAVQKMLGVEEDSKGATAKRLAATELSAVGIEPDGVGREQFLFVEIPLLNRIKVRGVVRAVKLESPGGVQVAWEFDPRFDAVSRWRTTWTKIEENALGDRVEGPPQPYKGCGGIVTVRKLAAAGGDSVDMLVVESRMVICEPEAWFQGSNLLRSKIPLTAQEGVRRLRRKLAANR
jgi:hypothetical protein